MHDHIDYPVQMIEEATAPWSLARWRHTVRVAAACRWDSDDGLTFGVDDRVVYALCCAGRVVAATVVPPGAHPVELSSLRRPKP